MFAFLLTLLILDALVLSVVVVLYRSFGLLVGPAHGRVGDLSGRDTQPRQHDPLEQDPCPDPREEEQERAHFPPPSRRRPPRTVERVSIAWRSIASQTVRQTAKAAGSATR